MTHVHKIVDSDVHFIIDPATRAITSETRKLYITQYDHNSERFTFKIPRIMEGHDMMECDTILVDFNNASTTKKDNNVGEYISTDKVEDGEFVLFSWLVSQDATKLVGSLSFSVSFICHDDDGNIVYEWGTDTYKRITVLEKSRYSQAIVEKYPDVLEQIKDDALSATEVYVKGYAQPKGDYLTEHQSLDGYATEKYVDDAIKQNDIPHGVTSWNDLTDKPFGEEKGRVVIEWDGDTEGRDEVIIGGESCDFYKVSDLNPSMKDLDGGYYFVAPDQVEKTPFDLSHIVEVPDVAICGEYFAVLYKTSGSLNGITISAPSTGIYLYSEGYYYISEFSYDSGIIKTLEEKFIPDTIARVENTVTEDRVTEMIDEAVNSKLSELGLAENTSF